MFQSLSQNSQSASQSVNQSLHPASSIPDCLTERRECRQEQMQRVGRPQQRQTLALVLCSFERQQQQVLSGHRFLLQLALRPQIPAPTGSQTTDSCSNSGHRFRLQLALRPQISAPTGSQATDSCSNWLSGHRFLLQLALKQTTDFCSNWLSDHRLIWTVADLAACTQIIFDSFTVLCGRYNAYRYMATTGASPNHTALYRAPPHHTVT